MPEYKLEGQISENFEVLYFGMTCSKTDERISLFCSEANQAGHRRIWVAKIRVLLHSFLRIRNGFNHTTHANSTKRLYG